MENDYIILYEAASEEEAQDISQLLIENNFDCIVVNETGGFDGILGTSHAAKITIQINRDEYKKAKIFLASLEEQNSTEDSYLNDFSNDELLNILKQENDWSVHDVNIARKLITQRGIAIDEEKIQVENKEYLAKIDEPEKAKDLVLILGFLLAVLGGLLGIAIGYFIMTLKKSDSSGNKIYYYNENSRFWGSVIFYTGIFVLVFILKDIFFDDYLFIDSFLY